MKKVIITVLILMVISSGYVLFPYGTRAIGMGMAYYALSDDANGVFFNPAGLVNLEPEHNQASVMVKVNDRDLEALDSIAVAGHVYREEEKMKFSIAEYLRQDFKPEVHEKKLYFNYAFGALFYKISTTDDYYKMNNVYVAAARKILKEPRLSLGITLLSSNHETNDQTGTMTCMNLGLLYKFNKMIDVGLVAEDLLKNGPYRAPILLNLGVLVRLNDTTKIEVDGYNLTSEDYSWRWRDKRGAEFRIGFEKSFINDTLTVRLGSKNGNLDFGFGAQVTPNFRIDYAMNYDNKADVLYNPLEYQHFVSAKIRF